MIQTHEREGHGVIPINYALFENNLRSDPNDCAAQARIQAGRVE